MTRAAPFGGLLLGAFLAFGIGTTSAETPRWLFIYGIAGLASLCFTWEILRSRKIVLGDLDLCVLGFFLWAGVSLAWTVDPRGGIYAFARMGALVWVYFLVRHADWDDLERVLKVVVPLGLIGAFLQYPFITERAAGGFGNINFLTEWALISAPFLVLFAVGRRWLLCLPGLVIAVLFYLPTYLAYPTVVIGGLIGLAWLMKFPRKSGIVFVCVSLFVMGILAWHGHEGIRSSMAVRFELILNTLAMIADAPIRGHGLGSFHGLYDFYQETHLAVWPALKTTITRPWAYVGTAHNEFLQTWAELGMIGAGLILYAVYRIFTLRSKKPIWYCACASLAVSAILSVTGFPWQVPASAVIATVSLGIVGREQKIREYKAPRLAVVPALASIFVLAYFGHGSWWGARDMSIFRQFFTARPLVALEYHLKAYEIFPYDHYIRRQLPQTVSSVTARYPDKVVIEPEAADQLYDVGISAAPHSPAVLIARVEYLLNSGRFKEPETETLLYRLREKAGTQAETWVADAFYALKTGNGLRMQASAYKAVELDPDILNRVPIFNTIVAALREIPK